MSINLKYDKKAMYIIMGITAVLLASAIACTAAEYEVSNSQTSYGCRIGAATMSCIAVVLGSANIYGSMKNPGANNTNTILACLIAFASFVVVVASLAGGSCVLPKCVQ